MPNAAITQKLQIFIIVNLKNWVLLLKNSWDNLQYMQN